MNYKLQNLQMNFFGLKPSFNCSNKGHSKHGHIFRIN